MSWLKDTVERAAFLMLVVVVVLFAGFAYSMISDNGHAVDRVFAPWLK